MKKSKYFLFTSIALLALLIGTIAILDREAFTSTQRSLLGLEIIGFGIMLFATIITKDKTI